MGEQDWQVLAVVNVAQHDERDEDHTGHHKHREQTASLWGLWMDKDKQRLLGRRNMFEVLEQLFIAVTGSKGRGQTSLTHWTIEVTLRPIRSMALKTMKQQTQRKYRSERNRCEADVQPQLDIIILGSYVLFSQLFAHPTPCFHTHSSLLLWQRGKPTV